ncbi:MAG: hypothetical protein AABX65_04755, partial [Nanoarchaeota archaeon]
MGEEIFDVVKKINKRYEDEKFVEEHKIIYDSPNETLEPIYFWILDFMNQVAGKTEKLVDNFVASPGSGQFGEIGQRISVMQQNATKIMGDINTVIKSIINIIYDLKEFETRLEQYKLAKSKDKNEAEAGLLSLKQIWMDSVDVKRGNSSIKGMAAQFSFVTLIDAFMSAKSANEVDKMELNDRVKRILKPRMYEFMQWKDSSEKELEKRYNLEKTYLKSQVSSLKMYTRWAKPYLRAAAQLEMQDSKNPALVKAFSTSVFELTVLGSKEVKLDSIIADKLLPKSLLGQKLKREYYSCVLTDFFFRGIPQRTNQGQYIYGGRAEVTIRGFCLNGEELAVFKKELDNSDLNQALKLATDMTDESLKTLQEDLENYAGIKPEKNKDEKKEKMDEKKSSEDDINPFTAIFGSKKKDDKKEDITSDKIKPDTYIEERIREIATSQAKGAAFNIFDIYKKAHGMAS